MWAVLCMASVYINFYYTPYRSWRYICGAQTVMHKKRNFSEPDLEHVERKDSKKERKRLRGQGFTQRKKADEKKWTARFEHKIESKDTLVGQVLAICGEKLVVQSGDQTFFCSLKGHMKQWKDHPSSLVTIGDQVCFLPHEPLQGKIVQILPRSSLLERQDSFHKYRMKKKRRFYRAKSTPIAANINLVIVTMAFCAPPLDIQTIDQYLLAAHKTGIPALLLLNKMDYQKTPPPSAPSELLLSQQQLLLEIQKIYPSLGIPTLSVSIRDTQTLTPLLQYMAGKQSVFTGPSGVGKSSLINLLTKEEIVTKTLNPKTLRGRHTTTTSKMLPLKQGPGFCIDTPGIGHFECTPSSRVEIQAFFKEFEPFSSQCKYDNCTHLKEPSCMVCLATQKALISPLRFHSYSVLMQDTNQCL